MSTNSVDSTEPANDQNWQAHLKKDCDGYVRWRGRVIEHYSFTDPEKESVNFEELGLACLALEKKGFVVTNKSACFPKIWEQAPAGTPWLQTLERYYTAFDDNKGRCACIILSANVVDADIAVVVRLIDGKMHARYLAGNDLDSSQYLLFHEIQSQGFDSNIKYYDSYDGFVRAMTEAGITPEMVSEAIENVPASLLVQQPDEDVEQHRPG